MSDTPIYDELCERFGISPAGAQWPQTRDLDWMLAKALEILTDPS